MNVLKCQNCKKKSGRYRNASKMWRGKISVSATFTVLWVSWLPEYFPSPDTLAFILMAVNSLLVIIILTARFAKNLRTQLTPLFEATAEVSYYKFDYGTT